MQSNDNTPAVQCYVVGKFDPGDDLRSEGLEGLVLAECDDVPGCACPQKVKQGPPLPGGAGLIDQKCGRESIADPIEGG